VTVLRYWLAMTVVVVSGLAIWAFAPVLLFVFLLVAGLGALSAAMILLAKGLRSLRDGDDR
jgi:hypothetical protein